MKFLALRGYALAGALRIAARGWGVLLLAVLLAGLALALPAAVGLLSVQLLPLAQHAQLAPEATVFIDRAASTQEGKGLQARAEASAGVAQVRLLPRDAALADLLKRAGQDAALPVPAANPLPDALILSFAPGTPPATVEATVAALRQLPRVESVQADTGWYRKLATLGRAAEFVGAVVAAAGLVLTALTLIGAVRLLTVASVAEVRTLRLLGADERFIRRPLVYAGFGALLLALLLAGTLVWTLAGVVQQLVAELAQLYGVAVAPPAAAPEQIVTVALIALIAAYALASLAARAALRNAR